MRAEPELHPFLPWSDAYELGITAIDEQHRVLVDLVNELGDDLRAGRDRETVLASLRALMRFTAEHFATEERIMAEHGGGAGEQQHRLEHRRLFDEVRALTIDIDTRGAEVTMHFLRDWLLHHIDEVDRPLCAWLRERGLD